MDPTVANSLCLSSDVAICESSSAMDVPEEDKGVVVFRADSDAAAFVADHSRPHDGSLLTEAVAARDEVGAVVVVSHCDRLLLIMPSWMQPSNDHAADTSPTPTAVGRATPSDIRMTTAVEVPDLAPAEPTVKTKKPRHKKIHKDAAQEPTRQRQPRAAANQERLSQLAKGEHEYHSKAKRGLVDDLEDLVPTSSVSQQSTSAPPAIRRAKKSKLRAPSEDRDDPMSAVEAEEDPSESVSAPPRPSRSKAMSVVSIATRSASGPRVSNRFGRKKVDAARKERKIKGADPSARPLKRQRGKHSEANPTEASSDTPSQEERRRKKPSTAYSQVDGDLPAASPSTSPLQSTNSPETTSHQPFDQGTTSVANNSDANPAISEPSRTVKPLRPQGVRSGLPGLGAPIAAPARLGIPDNVAEMNHILCDAAAGARMELRNTATVVDEWTPDLDAQDAPPDSDDEEDIPLSYIVSLRREVQGTNVPPSTTNVLDDVGITEEPPKLDQTSISIHGSAHPDTCPWSSFVRPRSTETVADVVPPPPSLPVSTSPPLLASNLPALPPPVIPNLVGTRVPRPIPPPTPQKKRLEACPTIWAKVRRLVLSLRSRIGDGSLQSRQEVCESFDWFRSYQSGVYHANGLVKGYLLSAFSAR